MDSFIGYQELKLLADLLDQDNSDIQKHVASHQSKVFETDSKTPSTDFRASRKLESVEVHSETKDTRIEPVFNIKYRQVVGTETIYLNMEQKANAINDCQLMIVAVELPNTKSRDVVLEIKDNRFDLSSPLYKLKFHLPYKVSDLEGKAQFFADDCKLVVELPVLSQ